MTGETLPRTFGPYTLLKLLARGGMGEIFLARATGLAGFQKYYALKKLLTKFVNDSDVTTRFIDEAKLGARLCHPNVVQVFDLGRIGNELYMASEFVDGFDLRRILRFCHEKKRRIPIDIALFIVREILSGMAYAHKQVDAEGRRINLIHRDISPQNVLVSFEGEVKIIDFGLAKSTQRSSETQANVLLGNFGYMSPEQARGKRLDERTDVYSAGIVLFELVTGTKRFVDDNPLSLLEKVAHPAPLMPSERTPGIATEVDQLFARAVHPDRERRFATAAEFRDELTRQLHKINPRAAREPLAAFLEHLFLGGPAPTTFGGDDDPANHSVSVVVKQLVGDTAAFTSTKEGDLKNRALTEFEDDAPQTQGHDRMRLARLGDLLDVVELMSDVATAPAAPEVTVPTPRALAPVPAAPAASGHVDPASRPPQLVTFEEPEEIGVDLDSSRQLMADATGSMPSDDEPTRVTGAPQAPTDEPIAAPPPAPPASPLMASPRPLMAIPTTAFGVAAKLAPLSPRPPITPADADLPDIDEADLVEVGDDIPIVTDSVPHVVIGTPAGFLSTMPTPLAAPAPIAPVARTTSQPAPPVPPPAVAASPIRSSVVDNAQHFHALPTEIDIEVDESNPPQPLRSDFAPVPAYESLIIDFDDVSDARTAALEAPPVATAANAQRVAKTAEPVAGEQLQIPIGNKPTVRFTRTRRAESLPGVDIGDILGEPASVRPPVASAPVKPTLPGTPHVDESHRPAAAMPEERPAPTPSRPAIPAAQVVAPPAAAPPIRPAATAPSPVEPAAPGGIRPALPVAQRQWVRRRDERAVLKRDETTEREDADVPPKPPRD